jgi:hypothetical protein
LRRRRVLSPAILIPLAVVLVLAVGAGVYFGFIYEWPSGSDAGSQAGPAEQPISDEQPVRSAVPMGRELADCLKQTGSWETQHSGDGPGESHTDAASPRPHRNLFQIVIFKDQVDAQEWEQRWREKWARKGIEPEFTVDEVIEGHTAVVTARFPLDAAEREVLTRCIPRFDV